MNTQYKNNISAFIITALCLVCPQIKASEEASIDVVTYAAITSIVVHDPVGEMYVNTHNDGTDNVYLHQEIINPGETKVTINNQDRDGQFYARVSYSTSGSGNVVRGVRAQPGSSAYGVIGDSGENIRGNVVEDVQTSGGGSAYGIVSGGGTNISGNVVSGVGSGGSGAYGIVVGSGSSGNISGNVVSGIRGSNAHGIVIGGHPQRSQQNDDSQPHVRHTFVVPENQEIRYELIAAAGRIKTDGATGTLNTNNETGNSTIENHVGSIDAQSTTGDIIILSYQAGVLVTLSTTTGHLNSPLAQALEQTRGRGRSRRVRSIRNKQIGDGKYKISARTTTGNIKFTPAP